MAALRDALQEQTQRWSRRWRVPGRLASSSNNIRPNSRTCSRQALAGFQGRLENVLNPHREEMQRRSEAILEEINARIRATFEEASRQAVAQFDGKSEMVQPHVTRAEEAVHRLAGGGRCWTRR